MKTSSIVSSLLTASLASAIAIERRDLFGAGTNSGAVSASVAGASICVDIFGNGCAKTTSTTKAATTVAATPTVTVQAQAQTNAVVVAGTSTSTSTSVAVAATPSASSNTNTGVAYNAQTDYTLNSYTGYYGQGCPSGHGASAVFPSTLLLTSLKNPLQVLNGYSYETTPDDVCTQMTFIIPASTTGWKTCTFNVQVPSYYELSKETLSYDGPGDFTFDGVANGIQPFDFNLPLVNWYGTAPGLSKVVGSLACNIPAGITTTVVGRLCSKDTTVKYTHNADTCKVGVYLQPFA